MCGFPCDILKKHTSKNVKIIAYINMQIVYKKLIFYHADNRTQSQSYQTVTAVFTRMQFDHTTMKRPINEYSTIQAKTEIL